MRSALGLLLCTLTARGAVDGVVVNRTTGARQGGATVTLYKLGEAGMESLETVKSDAAGKFRMNQTPAGPHLIQAAWDGVTYNRMLPPGTPPTGIEVEVYNATTKAAGAQATTHMVLYEPGEGSMAINESILFRNDSQLAYNDPKRGTLRFYLPPEAGGRARVLATAPQGMPIERAAEKTAVANVHSVDFPIKPGETRFDITYTVPFQSPGVMEGRVLHGGGPVRFVAPRGVTLQSAALKEIGQEPNTQATIYELSGAEYRVEIQGSGSLRAAEGGAEEGGSSIQQIPARLYDRFWWILALSLAILLLTFLLQYRRATAAGKKDQRR